MNIRLLAAAALCCLAGSTWADDAVYRCGPDGRVFSQMPCRGGTVVGVAPPPSAQDQAHARDIAQRERIVGDDMERSRLADAAARGPQRAASLTVRPPKKGTRAAQDGEPDSRKWYTKPRSPASKKKRRKAQD